MRVRVYVYTCVCAYVCMRVCAYVYRCIICASLYMCICVYVCMRICVSVYMCIRACMYTCTCAHASVCTCVYAYMRVHVYAYLCICVYAYMGIWVLLRIHDVRGPRYGALRTTRPGLRAPHLVFRLGAENVSTIIFAVFRNAPLVGGAPHACGFATSVVPHGVGGPRWVDEFGVPQVLGWPHEPPGVSGTPTS